MLATFALAWLALAIAPRAADAERWEQVGSLAAAGSIRQIVAGRSEGDLLLYVVVERWGAFSSLDGGRNWRSMDRYLPHGPQGQTALDELALHPEDARSLLAALEGPLAGGQPAIFRSFDGGLHWLPRRGLGVRDVGALAVAPDGVIYAANSGRLYRSEDSGDTWFEGGSRPTDSAVLVLAADASTLYIGTRADGLWLTSDRGMSWRSVLDRRTINAVAAPGDGRVYAGADDGLYYSANGGASWRAVEGPLLAGAVAALAAAPGAPERVYAALAGGGLRYSADGGARWMALDHTLLQAPVTALAVDPTAPQCLYVGTAQGLWRCTLPEARADGVGHGHD